MKLAVLGATGGIGLEIDRQAIEQGHVVTALVRRPEPLKQFGNRITAVRGDVLDIGELSQVIEGHDAVLSGFGPRVPISKNDHNLLRRFAVALTTALERTRIRRAVIVSTAFLFKDSILPPANLVGRLFFPNMVVDATGMEDIFGRSGLDWTLVRPPRLTDRPATGRYRIAEGHLPSLGFTISRADVADFMIKTVGDRSTFGKVIGVSN
jgi:putative NADH-flavin reductase